MTYYFGDALDLTGIQITLIDPATGTRRDVTAECVFDPADGETVLAPKVKITFDDDGTELTASLKLTVDYPNIIASGDWWTLYNNGFLYIYRVGAMPDYGMSKDVPWYRYRYFIKSAMIANTTTTLSGYAFYGYSSLTSVTIGDSVTLIGVYACKNCTSLTSVTIGDSVTLISREVFYGCSSLTSVTIGDSVTLIGAEAFRGCTSLTSVTIPDSVTQINVSAFWGCTSLTSVTIGDSVTHIGDGMFCYCTALTSVTIPHSMTTIRSSMFYGCTSLTSVTIPDSVTQIGDHAFYNCTKLKDVYYGGTESQWRNISINTFNTPLTSATKHYNSTGPA